MAGTLLNLGTASSGIFPAGSEQGMALLNNVTSPQFASLHNFIEDAFEEIDLSNPQAYLVYIYFNKDSLNVMPQYSGVLQVGDPNTLSKLEKLQMLPTESGFLYTYVTNRSESAVFFDKLTIKYWKPKVRVQYDYYPYGLPWENPAVPSVGQEGLHDHLYQDKEFQFKDFADGNKGLMLYDFHARMYDPTTAMWMVPDPAAQFANPYLAMGNNPVISVDPDGRIAFWIPIAVGATLGAYVGASIQQGDGGLKHAEWLPKNWDNTWWQGATVGAIAGAGIGYMVSLSMASMGFEVTGLSAKSTGFAGTGSTTPLYNILSNAIITGNINMISSFLRGEGWRQTATTGLVGLGAGALGGLVGSAKKYNPTTNGKTMNTKGIRAQNYFTNILNGAGDRLTRSLDSGHSGETAIRNTFFGAAEGAFASYMFGKDGMINFGSKLNDSNNPVFGRYFTGLLSNGVTSNPGASMLAARMYGSVYLMWTLGKANDDIATGIWTNVMLSPFQFIFLSYFQRQAVGEQYPYAYDFLRP